MCSRLRILICCTELQETNGESDDLLKEYIRHIGAVKSIRRAIGHAEDLKRIEDIDERLQSIDDAGHGHVTVASGSRLSKKFEFVL